MIPDPDLDPLKSGVIMLDVMIPGSDTDPESDFQFFRDSGSEFGSSKGQNCNTCS